jgi:predicted membrane protein
MLGYYYPNEAAEPLLWHPVLFAYTLLVSGADLLILAALAYLTGSLRKAIPLMTMLGIGFFAVVLAGPLADLRSPHKAYLIFTGPHIISKHPHSSSP